MRKEEEGRKNREIGGNEQQSETLKSGIKVSVGLIIQGLVKEKRKSKPILRDDGQIIND